MRSILFASTTALLLTAAACSNTPPVATTGTGGSSNSGGSTGTGGASTGTGGGSTGGSTGTGGSDTSTGGTGVTGQGGSGTGGGLPGTGGASTGGVGGGATGTGGNVGGNPGTGGVAGISGGGMCNNGDCTSIVGKWDGALTQFPCSSMSTDGYDCMNACPGGGGKTTTFTYPIGGTPGTIYDVTLEAKGIVEVYQYVGATFPPSYTNPIKGNGGLNNLFTIGGTQQSANNGGDYNTYEIDVSPAVAGLTNVAGTGATAHNVYYLNGVPANETPHNGPTTHLTFCIDDLATIKVPAGGTVTFKSFDSNCVQVENCGSTRGSNCSSPQSVSLAGAVPFDSTVMSFNQSQPWKTSTGYGQWVLFDIKNVTAAQ